MKHVSYFCTEDLANSSRGVSVVGRDLARSLIHGTPRCSLWQVKLTDNVLLNLDNYPPVFPFLSIDQYATMINCFGI